MKKKIAIILVFCMVITCFSGIAIAKDINNSTSNNSTSENTTKSDDSSGYATTASAGANVSTTAAGTSDSGYEQKTGTTCGEKKTCSSGEPKRV